MAPGPVANRPRLQVAVCSVHTGARKPSQGWAVVGGARNQEEPSHQAGPPALWPKTHISVSLPACLHILLNQLLFKLSPKADGNMEMSCQADNH